ncbi:MAG: MBL fold metallo-hydrolase [Gemmataceae bacterium]
MEVAPGVHHFNTDPFNWYVIEDSGRLTLVDAGFPGHYETFVRGIQSLGCAVQDVEAIIITHAHADHTGFAERVRKETGKPLFVHAADLQTVQRSLQLPWKALLGNSWRSNIRNMLTHAMWNGVFTMPRIQTAYAFQDGDELDVPGRPHVLHTPGHTPGEVAFYLPDRQVLLSGDTLVTRNLFTGEHGGPQVTNSPLNDDVTLAHKSLDRLRELGNVTLLSGHGKPWTGEIAEAIDLCQQPQVREGQAATSSDGHP